MPSSACLFALPPPARYLGLGLLVLTGLCISSPAQIIGLPAGMYPGSPTVLSYSHELPFHFADETAGDLEIWAIP